MYSSVPLRHTRLGTALMYPHISRQSGSGTQTPFERREHAAEGIAAKINSIRQEVTAAPKVMNPLTQKIIAEEQLEDQYGASGLPKKRKAAKGKGMSVKTHAMHSPKADLKALAGSKAAFQELASGHSGQAQRQFSQAGPKPYVAIAPAQRGMGLFF